MEYWIDYQEPAAGKTEIWTHEVFTDFGGSEAVIPDNYLFVNFFDNGDSL